MPNPVPTDPPKLDDTIRLEELNEQMEQTVDIGPSLQTIVTVVVVVMVKI